MPLYVVKHKSLELERAYERSPVISLVTNAPSEDDIPTPLREASDHVTTGDLPLLRGDGIPEGSDAAILWMAGDQLRQGSSAGLRGSIFSSKQSGLVPIHFPCHPELDLIGLHPLIWKPAAELDIPPSDIRIAAAAAPAPEFIEFLEKSPKPWARITRALFTEQRNPGEGTEQLSRMWSDTAIIPPAFGALLVRNLIVLVIRQNNLSQAENLARLAMDRYPRCAELAFLSGWICIQLEKLRTAGTYARQALESADPSFVGSGGEGSYRSQWLLGLAFELDGKQGLAIQCYHAGAHARPAFLPSILGILRQRVNTLIAGQLYYSMFANLVRREPQYSELIFHYLLLHRQLEPARRLLDFTEIPDEARQRLQKSLDEASAAMHARPRPATVKPGVMLIGPFYVHSSIARINRELGAALSSAGDLEVAMEPHTFGDVLGVHLPHFQSTSSGFKRRLSRLDLTIRHHWPPEVDPPACGKLVAMVHWEYGSAPKRWVEKIEKNVAELWVSSQFTKGVFERSGVNPNRIRVMPPGIDTDFFRPDGPSWRPEGCRRFVFLFVGGAIPRKGADVLWKAYSKAFRFTDDATLVIKDIGASTFYKGQSLAELIRAATRAPRSPHVIILNDEMDDAQLASLYRGSDIFVLPYRGEGFGMPLAEALACGKPVITTGLGPAREFCPPEASFFISARVLEFDDPNSQAGPTAFSQSCFDPDVNELAATMRQTFERGERLSAQGLLAAEKIRADLSWDRVMRLQLDRIRQLVS